LRREGSGMKAGNRTGTIYEWFLARFALLTIVEGLNDDRILAETFQQTYRAR
jgi:hypothetical protein